MPRPSVQALGSSAGLRSGCLLRMVTLTALLPAFFISIMIIANLRWDLTWRIHPDYLVGTRSGVLKLFLDWHGDPLHRHTLTGWEAAVRTHDIDWAGRWLYSPSLGWYELPLWLILLLLLIPGSILLHLGRSTRVRRRIRRLSAATALLLATLFFAALMLNTWRSLTLTQGGATLMLHAGCLVLNVDHSAGEFRADGPVTATWIKEAGPRAWLPSWIDNGTVFTFEAPLWIPPLLLISAAVLSRRLARLDPRTLPGRCSSCGYDRSGLPPTAACPECGTLDSNTKNSARP